MRRKNNKRRLGGRPGGLALEEEELRGLVARTPPTSSPGTQGAYAPKVGSLDSRSAAYALPGNTERLSHYQTAS